MFIKVKKLITDLCKKHDMPIPEIENLESAPESFDKKSNYTSEKLIYLDIKGSGDLSLEGDQAYYASHIFCHYLCNLEQVPKHSDKAVDLISSWMFDSLINQE